MKKVLMGCGIVAVLAALVIGGILAWTYYFWSRALTSPAQVQAMADGIMRYDLPGPGVGLFAMDWMGMRWAMVGDREEPNWSLHLAMAAYPLKQQTMNQAQVQETQREIEQQMQQESLGDFVEEEARSESGTLCGEPVQIKVSNGYVSRNGQKLPAIQRAAGFVKNGCFYYAAVIGISDDRSARTYQALNSLRLP